MAPYDEALRYLLSLGHETLAVKLGLANIERLFAALGRPQDSFQSVQIAGTNGKGSTAAMLEAICRAAGIKIGLYTSPHLVSITERIRIDGRDIAPESFAHHAERVREVAESMQRESGARPTFFEQMTAIALDAFRKAGVQLAILETGLGGRLDATTAARAATVAITPIALDHQEYLGNTLGEIAAEKAAIIRPGVTAIVAQQPSAAQQVIARRAIECGVKLRWAGNGVRVLGSEDAGRLRATFTTAQDVYEGVLLGLRGRHQATNAAVAIETAEALRERGFDISRAAIILGLEKAEHAGRLELIRGTPSWLFDGAHNAAGAQALRCYLDEFVAAPLTLLFGVMRDKDLTEISATLFPAARRLILTEVDSPRTARLEALHRAAALYLPPDSITLASSAAEAWRLAREQTPPDGVICVTGSLYLIGEVKALSNEQRK